MPYTYNSFQQALALEMVIPNANVSDPNFQAILPTIIDEAEQRCYRDLDLLYATAAQTTVMTPGARSISIAHADSLPQILILETMNVITPSTATNPEAGLRNQLYPVSKEFLDAVFGSAAGSGVPKYMAMLTDATVLVGPWPDQGYTVEFIGKYRPVPLYSAAPADGTQTTFLSSVLPDLFLAAAMVSAAGYRHNFGAQSDEPRMAISWEARYQQNLLSAKNEEMRKKFHGWGGTSSEQTPPPSP